MSWNKAIEIVTSYGLDDREIRVRVPTGLNLHLVQTSSGVQTVQIDTKGSFPRGEADQSPPTTDEVKQT
jgi:hypothetical protein